MASTGYKAYLLKEVTGTREIVLQGFKVKENEFSVSTVIRNAAFRANPIYFPFDKPGLNYSEVDLNAWCVTNKFNLDDNGVDTQPPFIVSQTLDAAFKILTITFNAKINNNQANNTALKALITLSTNGGSSYSALGGSDTVSTPDGTGTTLVVTFNSALSGSTNIVKIAALAIKDTATIPNVNTQLLTNTIDVTVPTVTLSPANSATGVSNAVNPTLTFSEKVFRGSDGAELDNSNAAALITLKLTDSSGAVVPFTVQVSDTKRRIQIIPSSLLLSNQQYYLAVAASSFRDAGGLPIASTTSTFTTAS